MQVAAQINPTDANTESDFGYALMRAGEIERARVPLMQAQQMAVSSPKIAGNLIIWLAVNDRKDDAASLAAHAQLSSAARKAIDEDVVRVKSAWRDRRLARERVPVAPRAAPAVAAASAPRSSGWPVQVRVLRPHLGPHWSINSSDVEVRSTTPSPERAQFEKRGQPIEDGIRSRIVERSDPKIQLNFPQ